MHAAAEEVGEYMHGGGGGMDGRGGRREGGEEAGGEGGAEICSALGAVYSSSSSGSVGRAKGAPALTPCLRFLALSTAAKSKRLCK